MKIKVPMIPNRPNKSTYPESMKENVSIYPVEATDLTIDIVLYRNPHPKYNCLLIKLHLNSLYLSRDTNELVCDWFNSIYQADCCIIR